MAAGLGFKSWATGDVLTANDVNGYLMQGVWVFANSAARTSAVTSPQEGNMSYLKDTNSLEYYDGAAWVAASGAASPLTTKGDLYTYTTGNARLGVGGNGQILVADSSATTGLRWQDNFVAGKNVVLNGDFLINQRNFTSVTADGSFCFDRFALGVAGSGTLTVTPQTFTLGSAPVSGYEGTNFMRAVTATTSGATDRKLVRTRLEDVRLLAGQTVTISFWAKAGSGTPKIAVELTQNFGTGGTPSASVNTYAGQVTLSTSWARYSVTVSNPSISGKTLGTTANTSYLELAFWFSAGSDFNSRTGTLGNQNATFDIWGVQVEPGSVATAFETATGTVAGELAACQRYYYRRSVSSGSIVYTTGFQSSTTDANLDLVHPVQLRVPATSYDISGLQLSDFSSYTNAATYSSAAFASVRSSRLTFTMSAAGAQYRGCYLIIDNNTGHFGASAEL